MNTSETNRVLEKKLRKFSRLKRQLLRKVHFSVRDYRARRSYINLWLKVQRLARQLRELQRDVRLAAAGSALILLAGTASAQAPVSTYGPYVKSAREVNPLRGPLAADIQYKPSYVDLDKDGDLDLVLNTNSSKLVYFKNTGTATKPLFQDLETDPTHDPFNGITGYSAPAFADFDKDGDLDMFVGSDSDPNSTGTIVRYYINIGGKFSTETSPGVYTPNEGTGPWNPSTKAGNPLNGLYPGDYATPTFADMDGDTDLDLVIGVNGATYINYYVNDGNGNFTPSSLPGLNLVGNYTQVDPDFVDLDKDGDIDLAYGESSGTIHFILNTGGVLNETDFSASWDPVAKTGNPFYGHDPASFGYVYSQAAYPDLDGDGDPDVVFGYTDYYHSYQVYNLRYLENTGIAVLKEVTDLDSPVDGIFTNGTASVELLDGDGDGVTDAVVMGLNGDALRFFKGFGDHFKLTDNIISQLDVWGSNGQFVDFDNDGDPDFVSCDQYGFFTYFRNDGASYAEFGDSDPSNPFNTTVMGFQWVKCIPAFVDIDHDGDLDMFLGDKYGVISYYKNDGGAISLQPAANNPLAFVQLVEPDPVAGGNRANIRFTDIDHDGDMDAFVGSSFVAVNNPTTGTTDNYPPEVYFYENTGTVTTPQFVLRPSFFPSDELQDDSVIKYYDFDKDGDLDAFMGNADGTINYYINQNPSPVVTIKSNLNYQQGTSAVVLDNTLTLADADSDLISSAQVSIQNFKVGQEILTCTTQAPVTSSFNTATGVLTLSGQANASVYQAILRTVTYQYTGPKPPASGRSGLPGGKTVTLARTISLSAIDLELSAPVMASIAASITFPNSPPVLQASGNQPVYSATPVTVDKGITVQDTDDTNLAGATVSFDPASFVAGEDVLEFSNQSGITGSYNAATGILSLTGTAISSDYQNALRSINYRNSSSKPTAQNRVLQFTVTDGETASNQVSSTVEIIGEIEVFNGVSANGDDLNAFFKIKNIETLEPNNKVTIYNRWGDRVFSMENYDNKTRIFNGTSDKGSELPSGVYYYKIEFFSGRDELSGYLTLKR
ncbi:MAG: VCBS repeat-containing protein [Bacteroidetes bacterium]|nr:VCBS repeat-containing protein [Bacteroidota bacterium]